MKNLIQIIPVIVIGLFASVGYSGQEGHGGEAVVCANNKVEVYDTYEAGLRGISPSLGNASLSALEKVDFALDRLAKQDPDRAEMYRKWAYSFKSEAKIDNFDVAPVEDGKHIVLPPNCLVRQVVDQQIPQFPEDKRYFVSKELWDLMDADQQAILILHEVIYREAMGLEAADSVGTRYLNSYIFSDKFDHMTDDEYFRVMTQVAFLNEYNSFITLHGFPFHAVAEDYPLSKKWFKDSDGGYSGSLVHNVSIEFQENNILIEAVRIDKDGNLEYFRCPADHLISVSVGNLNFDSISQVHVYETGEVQELWFRKETQIEIQGHWLKVVQAIDFYPDGKVSAAFIDGTYILQTAAGGIVKIDGDTYFQTRFDENGLVIDK